MNVKDQRNNVGIERKGVKISSLFESTAVPYSLVNLFILFALPGINIFMPAYAEAKNINGIGVFYIAYPIAFVVGRFFISILSRFWKTNMLIIVGIMLMVLSFLVFAFANNLNMLLLGGILYGFGSSSVLPGVNALAVSKCKPERRGVANSTFFASSDIGFLFGSLSIGFLAQLTSYEITYFVLGLITMVPLIIFLIVSKPKKVSK